MALYKDGKVYRTLEQQVGYLSEKQNEQEVINEEISQDIDDLEETVAVLPTKEYVDNADALKADKTYVDTELAKKLNKVSTTTSKEQVYAKGTNGAQKMIDISTSNDGTSIARRDSLGALQVTDPVNSLDAVNKGTMDTALSGKQGTLTTTSVNDGTVAKVIGFSSNGTLCKDSMPSPTVTPANVDSTGATLGETIVADGDGGALWSYPNVEAADILSGSATSGQVLTADGNGSADWQTPQSSGISIVNPSSPYRDLTNDEMTAFKNCELLLNINDHIYTYDHETSSYIYGVFVYYDGTYLYANRISITKSSGYWTQSSEMKIPSTSIEIVTLSSSSGTLSTADYNKLLKDTTLIKTSNGTILSKYQDDGTYIYYYIVHPSNVSYAPSEYSRVRITKSNKYYQDAAVSLSVSGTNIKSGNASSGQVLTADGSGGASWQNAGGGSKLYMHNITYYKSGSASSTNNPFYVYLTIYNTSSSQMSISDLKTFLSQTGNISCTGWGTWYSSTTRILFSITYLSSSDKIRVQGSQIPSGGNSYEDADVYTNIIDNVIAL